MIRFALADVPETHFLHVMNKRVSLYTSLPSYCEESADLHGICSQAKVIPKGAS